MAVQKQPGLQPQTSVQDELILVVKRSHLIDKTWHGLHEDNVARYLQRITDHQEFLPRSVMEQDPNYKQIIPYIIFEHHNTYFLMQRRADASEKRLQNKYTLGIGGHMRQEDLFLRDAAVAAHQDGRSCSVRGEEPASRTIVAWAQREFNEEVNYTGPITWQFLGLINDDTNLVGQVHLGLALLARGDSADISIKSELKSGQLLTIQECFSYYSQLETWSQFIVHHLMNDGG